MSTSSSSPTPVSQLRYSTSWLVPLRYRRFRQLYTSHPWTVKTILKYSSSFLFTKDEGPKTPFSEISVGGFGGWRRVMGVWVGLGPEVVSNPHEKGTSRDLLVC